MRYFAEVTSAAVFGAVVAVLAAACDGDDGGTTGPPEGPTTGTIAVAATTTGDDMDANGYAVLLDGTERAAIGSNGSVSLTSVSPGSRSVSLSGVAENCAVGGEHPRSVSVTAGATTQAAFDVTCVAAVGSIEVKTSTSGEDIDPDGYVVAVDSGTGISIEASETITLADVRTGSRSVELSGVAANCTVADENPRSVEVTLGGSASVSFDVACVPPPPGQIAFLSSRDGNQLEVYLMNGAGGGVTRVTQMDEVKWEPVARLSPDGSKILFAAGDPVDLWVVNTDGTGLLNLTDSPEDEEELSAVWSPDGTKIAYAGEWSATRPTGSGLWVVNADGTGLTPLSLLTTFDADWSPDGQRIVFPVYRDDLECCFYHLYSIRVDGSDLVQLTDGEVNDMWASWSPDGSKIVFSRHDRRTGATGIWTMNSDGTETLPIVPDNSGIPGWSPDGSLIAFAEGGAQGAGLDIINSDGTGRSNLSSLKTSWEPYWSPDGSTIAFSAWPSGVAGAGELDVYTIRPDGSGLANITDDPGVDVVGSWGP